MPKEPNLSVDDKDIVDRVLCKKEAADWWVCRAPIPSEDFVKMINILFKMPRKQVMDYYAYNWKDSRIKLKPTVLSTKPVPTQEVIANVPTNHRDNAIIKFLDQRTLFRMTILTQM